MFIETSSFVRLFNIKKEEENIVLSYVFMDNAREKFCVHHPLCNLLINKSSGIFASEFVF